jgi:hypothetical protein
MNVSTAKMTMMSEGRRMERAVIFTGDGGRLKADGSRFTAKKTVHREPSAVGRFSGEGKKAVRLAGRKVILQMFSSYFKRHTCT